MKNVKVSQNEIQMLRNHLLQSCEFSEIIQVVITSTERSAQCLVKNGKLNGEGRIQDLLNVCFSRLVNMAMWNPSLFEMCNILLRFNGVVSLSLSFSIGMALRIDRRERLLDG